MSLVDEHGQKLSNEPKKILDNNGHEIKEKVEETTKTIGLKLAKHLLEGANKFKTNEEINIQLDVLYHASLNIQAHRILNIGLGFQNDKSLIEWSGEQAFGQETKVKSDLTETVGEWKEKYFNGELTFKHGKKK